ncbi:MAG: hypothetical protein ACTSXL_02685 [Alphaproteobacteria bacterium]
MIKKIAILFLLSACGFTPMHKKTVQETTQANSILVKPISGKRGINLRQQLRESLSPTGDPKNPIYNVRINLHPPRVDLRGLRQDATATWGTVIAKADYVITKDGKEVLKSQETAFASYKVLSSVYSSMVGKEDSFDRATKTLGTQILSHINTFLEKNK